MTPAFLLLEGVPLEHTRINVINQSSESYPQLSRPEMGNQWNVGEIC